MAVRRQKKTHVYRIEPVKEPFSMLILNIRDECNMNECVSILKKFIDILKNSDEDLSHNISNIYQTLSRLYLENSCFDDAKKNAQEAVNVNGNHCAYNELGQIYKKELEKTLKDDAKKKELVDLKIMLEFASKAVKNFTKEQMIAQREYCKLSTMEISNKDLSDEDTISSRIPGYLGEISVIHIVMEALLNRLPNEKQKIINYASGKHENFHQIANENNIDINEHGRFLQTLFERSQHCIETILKHADTEKIQNMDHLVRICAKQSKLFQDETDSKLLKNLMKPNLTGESKVNDIRKYCKINQLSFLAYVKEIKRYNVNKFFQIQNIFEKLKGISKISELDCYFKICFLKANIGQKPILSFEDACSLSNELSNISLEELQKYETFFWYMVFHWPTQLEVEKKKLPATYDLQRLIRCIQKLKQIHDDDAKFVLTKKEQRHAFKLNPIYFLNNEEQYSKLEDVTLDTDYADRRSYVGHQRFNGRIKDQSNLEYFISDGTSLIIRSANLRYNRGSIAQYVTFHVGFTLAGPVAYNIDIDDRIQRLNNAE
ncbi:uncharacterized protein LOC136081903 [Hydra vulgaris]|uniref:Uncharacterized protein LOC136081903 n=1 Tax=Hydra vulgaris TaxID=6087 RepID=A0ABM4C467_HYDVU